VKIALIGLCAALCCVPLRAQIQLGGAPAAHKEHVQLVSDAVQVLAGSPQVVELRFRVDDGFHINSHTPKDELLIPTVLRLNTVNGVKVLGEQYPKGSTFRLPLDPGETLDVYQGEFRVSLRVVAPKGASTLVGELRYQACDNASCFPPRALKVIVAVTGE
jgi:Disulphide bond corrector protein DsbC